MSGKSIVWITHDDAKDLGIKGNEFPCRLMDFTSMVYEILKLGSPRDVVILPFYWNFQDTVTQIRNRGIVGPIIVYSGSEIKEFDILQYAPQGILFIDPSRISRDMALGFIMFLQKCQDMSNVHASLHKAPKEPYTKPSQDASEIKELFRSIIRERSRIILTCQFQEDLPTLTVTGEIIQLTGEFEPKLILDNFRPYEFIELYAQMAMGKPLSGFFTHHEETMGFDLRVDALYEGRIVAFLPERIYEQKRQYIRVEPDPRDPVTIHILPQDHQTLRIPVRDISEGGVGLTMPYEGLQKKKIYPVSLTLPNYPALPHAVMDNTQIFPVEPAPLSQTLLGTAEVVFKEEDTGGDFFYGLSIKLHSSDIQHLQRYVFKRQLEILSAVRKMKI